MAEIPNGVKAKVRACVLDNLREFGVAARLESGQPTDMGYKAVMDNGLDAESINRRLATIDASTGSVSVAVTAPSNQSLQGKSSTYSITEGLAIDNVTAGIPIHRNVKTAAHKISGCIGRE